MRSSSDTIDRVRRSAQKRMLYLPHAVRQMSRPERMISTADVRKVVENGELIEDYPEDVRGHSCLILGRATDGAPVHVVCAPKADYLAIITAYHPSPDEWGARFRERKKL